MTLRRILPLCAVPLVALGVLGVARNDAPPAPAAVAPSAAPGGSVGFDPTPWRRDGQAGVDRFIAEHEDAIAKNDPQTLRELDAICGQFDCQRTRLFWHTDLEAAKAQARREHKPILSLHLLGRFDEQLTCANSRFFRRLLYPDPRINAALRERFVLHWKTVRPVPKITIDFGDGRVMRRTITGNSAHYVLDEAGRPLDVIPGLYAPRPFLAALDDGAQLAATLTGLEGSKRDETLVAWHAAKQKQTVRTWSDGLRQIDAARAPRATGPEYAQWELQQKTTDEDWPRIAALHRRDAAFDPEIRKALFTTPDAWASGQIAVTKAAVENPMLRATWRVETTVLQDSVRNELSLHGRAHGWFAREGAGGLSLAKLNERVYRDLFLAPLDDPWYGLGVPSYLRELDNTLARAGGERPVPDR